MRHPRVDDTIILDPNHLPPGSTAELTVGRITHLDPSADECCIESTINGATIIVSPSVGLSYHHTTIEYKEGKLAHQVWCIDPSVADLLTTPSPEEPRALRYNEGKPELSFILGAPNALRGLSAVFAMGAKKYERDNWKKGLDKNKLVDSLLRHLTASTVGESLDAESELDHLYHVLWNALVLAEQHAVPAGHHD